MLTKNFFVIALGVLFALLSCGDAFFLNWGSPEPEPAKLYQPGHPQWPVTAYYQQRILQPSHYSDNNGPVQMPAIPIQVPLQAQLTPASSIQNVQLVPCLCPVAQDYDYEKADTSSIFVSQIKPQQPQA